MACFYLKELVPHEVKGLFNLCNRAGAFPAEICGRPPVQVICTLLRGKKQDIRPENSCFCQILQKPVHLDKNPIHFFLCACCKSVYGDLHGDGESGEPMSEDPLCLFLQLVILGWFNRDGSQLEGKRSQLTETHQDSVFFHYENMNVVQRINTYCYTQKQTWNLSGMSVVRISLS